MQKENLKNVIRLTAAAFYKKVLKEPAGPDKQSARTLFANFVLTIFSGQILNLLHLVLKILNMVQILLISGFF